MDAISVKIVLKCGVVFAAITLLTGCGGESLETPGMNPDAEIVTSSDGVPIAYEVHGSGTPALVFVHGWSCDRSYWENQLEYFSREFRVVTIDLAGHGESGLGREAWTIESFAGDVAAVVEALGLEHVVLIGHSMGGDVIVEAARRLSGSVEGLVWVDTYNQLGSARNPEQVAEFMAPFRANFKETTRTFVRSMFPPNSDESLVERVVADMSAAPPDVALAAGESALTYAREVTVALQELNRPVVAINAEDPPTDMKSMKRYGVEVILMSGVGHFLMMEDAQRFNLLLRDVVEEFLR